MLSILLSIQRVRILSHCSLLIIFGMLPFAGKSQILGANMSNPIVIGNYGQGTYTFSDTRNNTATNGYLNDYGQTSDDIYYKLTVQGPTTLSISLCSATFDTYLHLLNANGQNIVFNDDNGPLCGGLQSSLQTTVQPGVYYIVTEGYSSNTGSLPLSVSSVVQAPPPTVYDTRNFIRIWDASAPETNPNTLMTKSTSDVKQLTQYFDGLGRPEQTVIAKGSLSNNVFGDLVSPVVYDAFGREAQKYLSYVSGSSDGLYKTSPLTEQNTFYTSTSSPIYGQGETFLYGKTNFEASPLNRLQETFAPGNSWVGTASDPSEANRKSVKVKYYVNTVIDAVRIWTVSNSSTIGVFGTYNSSATYGAGQLFKNISVDENGKQVIEFKDKEGQIVLKKVQLIAASDNGSGSSHNDWLCTYYIYDDLNNLRCVIQPRGVELIAPSWALNDITILAEQCFRYEYDKRNRMIMKKVPGAGEVYMVYDARDRLVMTQDANMRVGEPYFDSWLITRYENVLNRPIETGTTSSSASGGNFTSHLTNAATSISYPGFISPGSWYKLSVLHYDDYADLPAPLTASLDGTYINSTNFITTYNTSPEYALQLTQSAQLKGMATWSQVKVLGTTSQYLTQVNFYDDKNRLIQVQSVNQTGGVDIATTQYDFEGKVLRTHLYHQKSGGTVQTHQLATKNTYDLLGRLNKVEKNINNIGYVAISALSYDALGQLKMKKLAPAYNSNAGLEALTYDYNIRGWLLGANRDYIKDANNTNYFGFDLGYDKAANLGSLSYTNPQYNGNIEGMIWKSKGSQEKRKYDFTYDAVNRLTGADFNQYTGTSFNRNAGIDFSVRNLAYDGNGNILSMNQNGLKLNASLTIDQLTYGYQTNTNKLSKVIDALNDNTSTLGDFKYDAATKGATDYSYDVNGNLKVDNNKKINGINYNYLNLPIYITVTGKGNISYTYDASGNKQKKETVENNVSVPFNGSSYTGNITTTTTYISGFIYESKAYSNVSLASLQYTDVLQFTSNEEGRIRKKIDGTFAYDYFLKDHLGNVRMVLTDEQQTLYYPAATLEGTFTASGTQANSMVNYEKQFYKIDYTNVVDETSLASWLNESVANTKLYYNNNNVPLASPNPNYPSGVSPSPTMGSTKLYKLNANTNKTGLEFMIKVMAGDVIDVMGKSYFLNTATVDNTNSSALDLTALFTALLSTPSNAIAAKGISASQLTSWNSSLVPNTFFRGANGETTTIPKAYINYIFLDEQFKFAGGNASRVGINDQVKDHWNLDPVLQNIIAPKNGYIFVYVSNESKLEVFFDNLQVIHKPGPILEETHYYPFGLTMSGISSKAAGTLQNKVGITGKELQSKEFSDGSGLELYDYGARFYDAQIGRWHKTDNKAELYFATSPYVYSLNQPTNAIDPDGNVVIFINGNHFGDSKEKYWKQPYSTELVSPAGVHSNYWVNGTRNFDELLMKKLGDNHNPLYYDGSGGGFHGTGFQNPLYTTARGRFNEGKEQGAKDAKEIIKNLEKDPNNNIIETIKVVTHSMGGAYGKGFVAALKEYIKTLPAEQQRQIKIEQVIDFDPYQGKGMTADGETPTFQFIHYGWMANEKENGKVDVVPSNNASTAHSIFSFFSDINQLQSGFYMWNAQTQTWDLQKNK